MYESDITKFMREFLQKHPEEVESQRKGRAIWWDKRPDERSPAPSMHHSPRSGGYEWSFGVDDNTSGVGDNTPEK
jgi:hypothetical protein